MTTHETVAVRAATGGVLPDGTTNHPPIDFDASPPLSEVNDRVAAIAALAPNVDRAVIERLVSRDYPGGDHDEGRFFWLPFESADHMTDALRSMIDGDFCAIVDESDGIIGYALGRDNAESITTALRAVHGA